MWHSLSRLRHKAQVLRSLPISPHPLSTYSELQLK